MKLYNACVPDGTCGFQLLYQMHRRAMARRSNRNADTFQNLYSGDRTEGFRQFITSLLEQYLHLENTPGYGHAGIAKLRTFLTWLNQSNRPDFEYSNWLSVPNLTLLTSSVTEHYSVLVYDPDKNPIPVLNDKENWLYLYHDTEYPDTAPSFTLPQLEGILKRNSFAIYANSHFYPLPTTDSLQAELDKALISLVERLLGNYNGLTNPNHLVVYYTNNLESCPERPLPRIPVYREYHETPKRTAPPTPHPTTA